MLLCLQHLTDIMNNPQPNYSYRSLGFFPSEDEEGIDARLWVHDPLDKRRFSDGGRREFMSEAEQKAADEYALAVAATLHSELSQTDYQCDGTIADHLRVPCSKFYFLPVSHVSRIRYSSATPD